MREVKRAANVGEKIRIVNAEQTDGYYDNGDIFTVKRRYSKNSVKVDKHARSIYDSEYVVLEEDTEETLTAEEVIKLLYLTCTVQSESQKCFGVWTSFPNAFESYGPEKLLKLLTEYKQSKQIHIVSKEEYDNIAADKLDEKYPKGWRLEE